MWKPSRNSRVITDESLVKKYSYSHDDKKGKSRIQRHSYFLAKDESQTWCFLDYRSQSQNDVVLDTMLFPIDLDFHRLLQEAVASHYSLHDFCRAFLPEDAPTNRYGC